MAFWWVNQNQTLKEEIDGGYMWSPRRNRNGGRNQFYDNMRLVEPGDTVFSFSDTRIQFIGIVQGRALAASKPSDFGLKGDYWNDEGWFVPVQWTSIARQFRAKDVIGELIPVLPKKYSPLTQDGNGLQSVYLASVPDAMAEILLNHGGMEAGLIKSGDSGWFLGGAAAEPLDRTVEELIANDTSISSTERESIIMARRGQGKFRSNVERIERHCRLTGVTDRRILKASHIRPWRSCENNRERLDGYNGLLLTPSADHLFDQGYLTFEDDGSIRFSERIDRSQIELIGLGSGRNAYSRALLPEQREYMRYHREIIFAGRR